MAVAEPLVLYEKRDGVAWVTLNRPDVLNAVNMAMRDDLWVFLQAVRDDPEVRVAVFRGAGDRAFSAGADISEFGTAPSYVAARESRHRRDLWGLMLDLKVPLVAAIHGYALGAGLEMSLLCDIRIAADDARFGLPEVNLGYIPSAGGTQMLPRTIPAGVARRLIMSGETIDAEEALRLGLVHRVVPRARLLDEAEALARRLASRSPAALAAVKEAVNVGLDLPLERALLLDAHLGAEALSSGDAREGLAAHREGRAPRFPDRREGAA